MAVRGYLKNIVVALLCFAVVVVLNFALPRLLPGDPVAYLTGFAEEEMTPVQYAYYRDALHLDEGLPSQFGHYLASLVDGTLGYSYKKEATVSSLVAERLVVTLQIALPALVLSTALGLFWGLRCGYARGSAADKASTSALVVVNAMPSFLVALVLIIVLCFQAGWFPYTGLSSPGMAPGSPGFVADRLHHLALPVLALVVAMTPSRFLLMRNTASRTAQERYVLYAQARGLSDSTIRTSYVLKNIAQPFIAMVGMSVGGCVGGSLVIENVFSVNGMGKLLTDAVFTLDYPLMQGILFVTALVMVVSIVVCDAVCILIDPKLRLGDAPC